MPEQESLIVFSPHFDDAVLGAWTQLRDLGGSKKVINFFSGEPEPGLVTRFDRIAGAEESASLMRERATEDAAALEALEARSENLGFLDNQYRPCSEGITTWGANPPSREELLTAIGLIDPSTTILAPAGLGGHADHLLVRSIALHLAREGHVVALYADIPYASHYGWPTWVSGARPTAYLDADANWRHYMQAIADEWTLEPRVRQLDEDERLLKLDAARTYRTQYPSLTNGPLDRLAHPHTLGFEVFWTVSGGG